MTDRSSMVELKNLGEYMKTQLALNVVLALLILSISVSAFSCDQNELLVYSGAVEPVSKADCTVKLKSVSRASHSMVCPLFLEIAFISTIKLNKTQCAEVYESMEIYGILIQKDESRIITLEQ